LGFRRDRELQRLASVNLPVKNGLVWFAYAMWIKRQTETEDRPHDTIFREAALRRETGSVLPSRDADVKNCVKEIFDGLDVAREYAFFGSVAAK